MPHSLIAEHATFAARFVALKSTAFSGTVVVRDEGETILERWGFHQGQITDLGIATDTSLLEAILLPSTSLKERDRKKLRKQAQQEGRDVGEVVLASGLLPEEEIVDRVLEAVHAQLAQLLQSSWRVETLPEEWPQEPGGIAHYLQLNLDVEDSLIAAARLFDDWAAIESHLPSLKDVFYATPSSMGLVQNPADHPVEVEILGLLDGERDLAEVVTLCGFAPFTVYDAAMTLAANGMIELINPVQLFQLGCEFERNREMPRALRRFERAEERGLDDFDLRFKLAEAYAAVDRKDEAIRHYMIFAEKCVGQFRIEDTIRACARIIAIDPDNLAIQDRYISLLSKYGKIDEALSQGFALAQRFCQDGKESRARATLEKILEIAEGNEEVLRLYLSLCESTGHDDGAREARRRLGNLFHGREESEKALELYQGLFVKGEDTPEIRSRLAELHLAAGNRDTAFEHLAALRSHQGWSPRNAIPQALEVFQRLLELDPRAPEITGWLVEAARARGDRDAILPLLAQHRDALASQGRFAEACRAAENLVSLQPLDLSAARALAHLEARHGDRRRAALHLEGIVKSLLESQSDAHELRLVLEELLDADPLSLFAREKLLDLPEAEGDSIDRIRLELETRLLRMVRGAPEPPAEELNFLDAVLSLVDGRLRQLHGDQAVALERYHRLAQLSIEHQRLDFLAETLVHLEELTPSDPQVKTYRERLEELRRGGSSRPQKVVHSSVSGITAKLRSLKGDGSSPPAAASETTEVPAAAPAVPTPPAAPPTTSTKALGAVAKLKSLKQSDAGDGPAGSEPPAVSAAPNPAAANAAPAGLTPPPKPKPGKLKGLEKLQALRGGPSAPPSAAEATAPPSPPADAGPVPQSTASDPPPAAPVIHPKPKTTKKLGGSASKLSALRQKSDG